jgi:hypothetical protein
LTLLREHLGDDAPQTDSGLWQMLQRLGITFTRGRTFTLSPDEHFEAKQAFIGTAEARTEAPETNKSVRPCRERLLYLDELTYELPPTIAQSWSPQGVQPQVHRGACRPNRGRLLGAMDARTGRLFYRQVESVSREVHLDLYEEMCQAYPDTRLWVVQDNTPVHFHEDVLGELEAQIWPRAHSGFEYVRPGHWADPLPAAARDGDLAVQVVPLPTYASWLNPIERLWRWLKQDVLHMHPFDEDWGKLQATVQSFLERLTSGSRQLLRYTGLLSGT